MKNIKKIFALFGLVGAVACTLKEGLSFDPGVTTSRTLAKNVAIPVSQVPLYADISAYNLLPSNPGTRADGGSVSLESLVDWKAGSERTFGGVTYRQIPFLQNNDDVFASVAGDAGMDPKNAVRIKKFLVETKYPDADMIRQIVTLVTDKSYCEMNPSFDFLKRPNFSGVILYSNMDGGLIGVRNYCNGQIASGELMSAQEVAQADCDIRYVTGFEQVPTTRDGDDGINDGMIRGCGCFGVKFNWITGSICIAGGSGSSGSDAGRNNGATGTGLNRPDLSSNLDTNNGQLSPQEPQCSISLSTNCPDDVQILFSENAATMLNIGGGGSYAPDTKIAIWPQFTNSVTQLEFDHWVGYFESRETDEFVFTIKEDVESTAYYEVGKPCTDKQKGVTNPMFSMTVAASNDYGNYFGGTYGETRVREDGSPRFHDGLDLYAEPGTPVYCMISGVVIKAISSFIDEDVPGSYGNVIWVESSYNGSKLVMKYCHLMAGNPIAGNYRTGSSFKEGDPVYQGEVIGYTGRTGNAFNVPNPHLHLSASQNGIEQDPARYINGTVNASKVNSNGGKIENIKCD